MPRTPRTRLDVDERRASLLDAASDLFEARAFDEVSVEDVARAAKVSKGLLYHYFPGKRHLYVALVERTADELQSAIFDAIAAVDDDADSDTRLRAGLRGWMLVVRARARTYEAVVRGGMGADAEVQRVARDMRERFAILISEALGAGTGDNRTRIITMGWIGFVESATLTWIELASDDEPTQVIDASVAVLQAALA